MDFVICLPINIPWFSTKCITIRNNSSPDWQEFKIIYIRKLPINHEMLPKENINPKPMNWQEIDCVGEKKLSSLAGEVTISCVMEFAAEKVLLMVGQKVQAHYNV